MAGEYSAEKPFMRNVEQIEWELTQLKEKEVSLIIPLYGTVSISTFGKLYVVEVEHRVGFHIPGLTFAIIFFAEDVECIEPNKSQQFTKTIRLLKRA